MYQKYFDILELNTNCSQDDLKNAFRQKAKQFHPDVNSNDDSEEKFIEVNEAYIILNKILFESEKFESSDNVRQWFYTEKQKAKKEAYYYAKMKYEEYINSPIYKATKILNPLFLFLAIPFGIFMFISPVIYITIKLIKGIPIITENFVALAGFVIIGIITAKIIIKYTKINS